MACVGLCWARVKVGTILGLSWAILGYVGTFWATLAPYWAHVEPSWAILGAVSAFVLDLGISVSLNFRPCKAFAKNTINTKEKTQFLGCIADGFCCFFFGCFCFFLLGHAALRLCLPNLGLMLGHWGLCRHHIGLMLSHFGVFCGLCWPLLGHIGLSWAISVSLNFRPCNAFAKK